MRGDTNTSSENNISEFDEQEAQYIEEQGEKKYQELCNIVAKELNTTLSIYNSLLKGDVDELETKGLVLKLNTYPIPTQFDVLKDGKKVAWMRMRGGRVKCYLGDGEKSEEIYEKNYDKEQWCSDMVSDFFTDKDLEESVHLINERLAA